SRTCEPHAIAATAVASLARQGATRGYPRSAGDSSWSCLHRRDPSAKYLLPARLVPAHRPHPRDGCQRVGLRVDARPRAHPDRSRDRIGNTCTRGRRRMKTWLTVAEAAAYAGVSRDTIYTACERRELRHARLGGRRAIRLKCDWIDGWLEQHACGAPTAARSGRPPPAPLAHAPTSTATAP